MSYVNQNILKNLKRVGASRTRPITEDIRLAYLQTYFLRGVLSANYFGRKVKKRACRYAPLQTGFK